VATKTKEPTNGEVKTGPEHITISPPAFRTLTLTLKGVAPYMQARFSEKALQKMRDKMEQGQNAKKGQAREARDFDADFRGAMHLAEEGWHGIPASAFRNAAIDACRMVGYQMTRARMSIFILADGLDKIDGTPLVRLLGPEPEKTEMAVRNATGVVDIRVRPMWREWGVKLRVQFDSDQFNASDVVNLLARAGLQVGVGEGRPFSKSSNGLGMGLFEVVNEDEAQ
jgi:hypothetical protein